MDSKERTYRAIEFKTPDRLPVYYFNKDIEKGDIVCFDINDSKSNNSGDKRHSDWGYTWKKLDDTMGQPEGNVIKDYSQLADYVIPKAGEEWRFKGIEEFIAKYKDKFIMAGPIITGFTIVTFIRGFEETLIDLYEDRENLEKIIDMVFSYENGLIEKINGYKDIDAFSFHDDWGSQQSSFISPSLFREVFIPRYKVQFDLLHKAEKKVFFHSCGYVYDLLDDLIDAGVDIFNFNQPDVMGIEKLSKYRGKVAFNCPVDLQKIAIKGTRKDIIDYVNKMASNLSSKKGGFIGYLEEYHSIGLSDDNYKNMEYGFKNFKHE